MRDTREGISVLLGTAWQDLFYNPSHRICSEDGASTSITEGIGHTAC